MAEAGLAVNGEAINKTFEGVDPQVKEGVLTALEFYSREKSENGNKIEDVIKVNKLKTAFNSLVSYLVNERMNKLNLNQQLFLATGAIADSCEINGSTIELLDPGVYSGLLETFNKRDEASVFNQFVYSTLDKMKALAEGKIELIDTSGKKKRSKTDNVDPRKKKAELEWKRNDAVKAGANLTRTLSSYVEKISAMDPNKLKSIKMNYDAVVKYFNILQKGPKITLEEKKMKDAITPKIEPVFKMIQDFLKIYGEIFQRTNEGLGTFREKIAEINEKDLELQKVGLAVAAEENSAVDSFNSEHADVIKRDISIINSFIVSASEKSPNRVPYSGARFMLTNQLPDVPSALENFICTPKTITASLQKILSYHINAFPKDDDGLFNIPPILLEPIRNYCDFLEDRFIMGTISGEPAKKGAYVSFNPIDMQVLKAIGMYLAKDPVYDYRGEINEGTFMGDYTGKIEKTAQVKWTGQDKKMNMVMSAELVDAASRDDAVNDYINFLFNALNGQNPPPKMSKRKINVLLRYATIQSLENNVKLLLQYVAQSEPTEVRDTILKYTNRSYDAAKEMVRKIVKEDQMVARVLGSNPEMVIAKIFV